MPPKSPKQLGEEEGHNKLRVLYREDLDYGDYVKITEYASHGIAWAVKTVEDIRSKSSQPEKR